MVCVNHAGVFGLAKCDLKLRLQLARLYVVRVRPSSNHGYDRTYAQRQQGRMRFAMIASKTAQANHAREKLHQNWLTATKKQGVSCRLARNDFDLINLRLNGQSL